MKKVCVITLHTVANYGSCLQTYATQRLLEGMQCKVEIVDYYRKSNLPEYAVEKAFQGRRMRKYQGLWDKAPFLKKVLSVPMGVIVKKQRKPFDDFRNDYLKLSERTYRSSEELKRVPPEADIYCTGSDQVWNSVWNNGFEEPFFLTFAPEGSKKIAFAASIGREELDDWEKPLMREALSRYSAISMRETSGVSLLNGLGIASQLVLDPTLMLTREDWAEIGTLPKRIKAPYILVYQLNKNPEFVTYVERVARSLNMDIVKVSYGVYDVMKSANTVIAPSVNDFLGLFLNAEAVITDSFHATAYAINFEIPFVSISPERFGTRISSILELTGTQDRMLKDYNDIELLKKPIDFEAASARLRAKRIDSLTFLKGALGD